MEVSSPEAGRNRAAASISPRARKPRWETTRVVLAMTTETRPSTIGTPLRVMSHAFTGSPPSVAVGVVTFTASPARRTATQSGSGGSRPGKA